jgi:hypothetical protein
MTVIESSSSSCRTMADGTLRLTVDIEPRHSQAAFALFGAPGTPMALAALQCAKTPPAEPAPKGGQLAQWVAMRCVEAAFQRWLQDTFPERWEAAQGDTPAKRAAFVVRSVCGVESRAELDNDQALASLFHALVRKPFEASQ